MKIVSWNVNGIRAVHKKDDFERMLKALKPDVLMLQETKAQEQESPVDLSGYEEFWESAKHKKGYSGVALFTKSTPEDVRFGLPEDLVEKYALAGDSYGNPNEEGRVIAADLGDFFAVSVYTPNAKGDLTRLALRHEHWDPAFLEYMKRLEEEKPVIFGGDLNVAHSPIDLANPKANEGEHGYTKEERAGIDAVLKAGFVDSFRHLHPDQKEAYSWWSHWQNARERNVGWRIDYLFASKPLARKIKKAEIHPELMGSDHCPVSITLG